MADEEAELRRLKEVDQGFNDMKAVLTDFAKLLEGFDKKLETQEGDIRLIYESVSRIFNELNIKLPDEDA